jgi:hypothetical protein
MILFGKPVPTFPDHAPSQNPPGANGCRFHSRASGAALRASARASLVSHGGPGPKPGPDSPANVSKRGLSARHSVPNQTLIIVNARLPKGNLTAGNRGRAAGYGEPAPGVPPRALVPRMRCSATPFASWSAAKQGPMPEGPALRSTAMEALHRVRDTNIGPSRFNLHMTAQIPDPAARCARVMRQPCPSENRGRRESRVRAAPAVSRAICA